MSPGTKLGDHIDEFNKLILDLANIDIEIEDEVQALMLLTSFPSSYENWIEDEDQTLMLLTSFPSSYENFMKTLLYGRESLTMEDVLATLNLRELKKRTEGTKEETSDGFNVNPTFGEPWCYRNDEMAELVKDSGLRRSLILLGTLEKKGYTVKMQMDRIKVIKGCRVMMIGIRKKNCVYTLEAKVMIFGVQKHGGSKQVGLKQFGSKQVGFKQLGHKQEAQGNREAEVFQVSNDNAAVAQRRLDKKQLEEKTNTDCLVKEREKVHLGIKVGAYIMVTRVPEQEGAEGNVAEKKKVNKSMKANLGKLLKYKA
ncbi:hypothetical protein Tco_0699943 [Tanacetum coccineum]